MKRILMAALVLAVGTLAMAQVLAKPATGPRPQGANKGAKAEQPDTKPAQKAAGAWVRLIDEGKYDESWDQAAHIFKDRVTKETWAKNVKAVREPFGKVVSRNLGDTQYLKHMPGAPDGEYVMMRLDGSFANRKDTTETVIATKEKDGEWRVSGYFIK